MTEWIESTIAAFASGEANSLRFPDKEPAWAKPLLGFSRGDDPLWAELKKDIGEFYWTPIEAFTAAFPSAEVGPESLSIICWILPQTERTKEDHRKEREFPSERWSRSRKYGEEFNARLRAHVVEALAGIGCEAVAPQLSPLWKTMKSEKYGLSSPWSERHAAFVSGLGTFGLCDGLITPLGKAMRCGSVIARLRVPPTPRPYGDRREYCLYFAKGVCGKCVDRCPAGAISKERGHDKAACQAYIDTKTPPYIKEHFGIDIYGCGLCQVGVPCESRIPTRSIADPPSS
jgi:epoxyqueuosine reductase